MLKQTMCTWLLTGIEGMVSRYPHARITYRIAYRGSNSNKNQIANPNTKNNEHRGTFTTRDKIHIYELGYTATPRKERTDLQPRCQEPANDEAHGSKLYNVYSETKKVTDDLLSRKGDVQRTRFKKPFPLRRYRRISNNNIKSHIRVGCKAGRLP